MECLMDRRRFVWELSLLGGFGAVELDNWISIGAGEAGRATPVLAVCLEIVGKLDGDFEIEEVEASTSEEILPILENRSR